MKIEFHHADFEDEMAVAAITVGEVCHVYMNVPFLMGIDQEWLRETVFGKVVNAGIAPLPTREQRAKIINMDEWLRRWNDTPHLCPAVPSKSPAADRQ